MSILTLRQAMLSGIGVPTLATAKNVQFALTPNGYSSADALWTAERGNVVFKDDPSRAAFIKDKYLNVYLAGNPVAGSTYPDFGSTGDILMLMVGKHSCVKADCPSSPESPTLTCRLGAGQLNGGQVLGTGELKLRMYSNLFGDTLVDDSQNSIGYPGNALEDLKREYHIPAKVGNNLPIATDNNTYTCVGLLDRSKDSYIQYGFRGNTQIHSIEHKNTGLGRIAPQTLTQNPSIIGEGNISGRIYGISYWLFPDGVPADWYGMSILMGEAWTNGIHSCPPHWGVE